MFWQVEDRFFFEHFIIFIIEDFDQPLPYKIQLLNITFITDDSLAWSINSTIEINDELIDESSLTFFKEMFELSFELVEDFSVFD